MNEVPKIKLSSATHSKLPVVKVEEEISSWSETIKLKLEDVDSKRMQIKLNEARGGKKRVYPHILRHSFAPPILNRGLIYET